MLWNREVAVSPLMSQNTFIALDSSRFHIRQRQTATVDISFEHASNFVENKVSFRVEERLALIAHQPGAAVCGSLVGSPS